MTFFRRWQRSREASRRGWASLGRLWRAVQSGAPDSKLDRLVRYSNRLYRLNYGSSAWVKFNGY